MEIEVDKKGRILVVSLMFFIVIIGMIIFTNHDSNISNQTNDEEQIYSDMEYGTFHSVSEDASVIYAYNSIPEVVIEGAKKYIKEKGYDNKGLYFVFLNSPSTFDSDYIKENILDYYNPEELIIECSADLDGELFYIDEIYTINNDINTGVSVGYFAINEKGIVTESHSLKNIGELSQYEIEPNLGGEGIVRARELLALDSDIELVPGYGGQRFFYEDSGEVILCFRYRFVDGSEIYINGITGERIK